MEQKIHHFLKMSNQITNINKIAVIFDKDFSTKEINKHTISSLKKYLKSYDKFITSYPSYCLESTFFTDLVLVSRIISEIIGTSTEDLKQFIEQYLKNFAESIKDITSEPYRSLKQSFNDQKINRKELNKVDFDDVARDFTQSDITYALTKSQVNDLLIKLKQKFCSDTTALHMGIIEEQYINSIKESDDFYRCHLKIVQNLIR